MRARNIKPGMFKNEILAECDPLSRILFTGLWCMADKDGLLEYRPKRIKAEILPYDSVNIEKLLDELSRRNFINIWCVQDEVGVKHCKVVEVVNFSKHQNPHKNEKPSEIKPLLSNHVNSGKFMKLHDENGTNPADSLILIPSSLIPDSCKNNSSSGDEDQEKLVGKDGVDFLITKKKRKLAGKRWQSFKLFWEAFGYKKGKREAADSWYDIPELKDRLVEKILCAAKFEALSRPDKVADGQTPKMAQGWITGYRWEDEGIVDTKTECTPAPLKETYADE